jgi:NTE family protein
MFGWLKTRKTTPTPPMATGNAEAGEMLSPTTTDAGKTGPTVDTETLKPHPLLALLPPGILDRLIADSAVSEYPKGTVVYRETSPCDAIYLILSGRCEARKKSGGGEIVETVAGPGDLLGDRALLNHEPHGHTVVVATHAVLLRIPASELRGVFAADPSAAGRFSAGVVEWPRALRGGKLEPADAVRRVVSILPLAQRLDADVMMDRLGLALRRTTDQRVLIVRLGKGEGIPIPVLPAQDAAPGTEFRFARDLHTRDDGVDRLHLKAGAEPGKVPGIDTLISHCARHYDYVLLHLEPDLPAPATIQSLIECDLGFVMLQASTQNFYDFQLLRREVCERTNGGCGHLKAILCAEESIAAPEFHEMLKELGHPLHSVLRGFPLRTEPSWPDRRFDLHVRRLAREIARCRVGLALSSGGAKGLAHIGVIQVLEENGIEVDCIAGSSMGAYIGAIWACGLDGPMLEKIAREVEGRWGLLRLVDPVIPPRRGFIRTRRVTARLRRSIGEAYFSDLIRPLRVVATRLDTLERVVFSSGDVARTVDASIAIPGVCVPVTMDGETYIDGGIADPLPVDVLMEMGIERIIAVNVIPTPEKIRYWLDCQHELNGREPKPSAFGRFLHRHFDYTAHGNILDTMMCAINGAQTRVAEASAREADVVLRPLTWDAAWHDFTRPQKYVDLGRATAEAQLAELLRLAKPIPYENPSPLAVPSPLAA